jgi:hypothetical protein
LCDNYSHRLCDTTLNQHYYPLPGGEDYDERDALISGWADFWGWYYYQVKGSHIDMPPNLVKAVMYKETHCGKQKEPSGDGDTNVMQVRGTPGSQGTAALGDLYQYADIYLEPGDVQDPSISTAAGTRYLILLMWQRYGNWLEALRHYGPADETHYNIHIWELYTQGLNPYRRAIGGDEDWYYLWRDPRGPQPPE